jgi:hypothetical protein
MSSCGGPVSLDEGGSPTGAVTEETSAIVQSELSDQRSRTYRVTVQNVTAGNGLSPPLVVVHSGGYGLFSLGTAATPGVSQIAETGGTTMLESELNGEPRVRAVAKAAGGPIPAGQKREIEVTVPAGGRWSSARLSVIAMIGRSNDSFVSTPHGFELSRMDHGMGEFLLSNFDAGSEENTGNVEDFGPGGHPVEHAEGLVSYDRGLNLRGNAPEIAAWGSTAAVVTIERVR